MGDQLAPLLIVGVFVNAGVGLILGASKDRTLNGLLWGLLFGPLGWIIILLLPEHHARKCPHCLAGIPKKAAKCRHCGSDLREEAPAGEDEWPPPRRQARKF